MTIYFAGSIRGGRDDRELNTAIVGVLRGYGKVTTEHVGSVGELGAIFDRALKTVA